MFLVRVSNLLNRHNYTGMALIHYAAMAGDNEVTTLLIGMANDHLDTKILKDPEKNPINILTKKCSCDGGKKQAVKICLNIFSMVDTFI